MPLVPNIEDNVLLHYALIGLRAERNQIDHRIMDLASQIQRQPNLQLVYVTRRRKSWVPVEPRKKRPPLSAEARKRIGAAQKKRWAKARRAKRRNVVTLKRAG